MWIVMPSVDQSTRKREKKIYIKTEEKKDIIRLKGKVKEKEKVRK